MRFLLPQYLTNMTHTHICIYAYIGEGWRKGGRQAERKGRKEGGGEGGRGGERETAKEGRQAGGSACVREIEI